MNPKTSPLLMLKKRIPKSISLAFRIAHSRFQRQQAIIATFNPWVPLSGIFVLPARIHDPPLQPMILPPAQKPTWALLVPLISLLMAKKLSSLLMENLQSSIFLRAPLLHLLSLIYQAWKCNSIARLNGNKFTTNAGVRCATSSTIPIFMALIGSHFAIAMKHYSPM